MVSLSGDRYCELAFDFGVRGRFLARDVAVDTDLPLRREGEEPLLRGSESGGIHLLLLRIGRSRVAGIEQRLLDVGVLVPEHRREVVVPGLQCRVRLALPLKAGGEVGFL